MKNCFQMKMETNYYKLPTKKMLIWLTVHILYTFLGSLLFIQIEECDENLQRTTESYNSFKNFLQKINTLGYEERRNTLNITKAFFVNTEKKLCSFNHEMIAKWWKFTTVTCYTIGYGKLTPKTISGKIATIFYAIIGIPMTVVLYTIAADFINKGIRNIFILIEIRWLKREKVKNSTCKTISTQAFLLMVFMSIASYVSTTKSRGGLSLTDSVYFWFQTITTIGYGDVYPTVEHNDFYEFTLKIAFVFGLGIAASLISSIADIVNKINGTNLIHVFTVRKTWNVDDQIQDSSL